LQQSALAVREKQRRTISNTSNDVRGATPPAQYKVALETRRGRLADCMTALSIDSVTRAQLWQAIRTVARRLLA